jgi:K+-sensing histidine kinase KdpD
MKHGNARSARALLAAFICYLLGVTALLLPFRTTIPTVVPFGLMLVICIAASWGAHPLASLYAAVLAFFFYNFFFTHPYLRLHITDPAERTLAIMLAVSRPASAFLGMLYRGEDEKQRPVHFALRRGRHRPPSEAGKPRRLEG